MKIMGIPAEAARLSDEPAHPNANAIWARALDAFGDESKARRWMSSPLHIFGGRSPDQLIATGDPVEQRTALTALVRIDYGLYS